ncbi:MAG: PH domain-containing protein [Bacteroidia bacterium]|nr:PH domain-containing protein [Bacteroidia bacterium]
MESIEGEIIEKATFNTILKTYILFYVSFFLLISVIGIPLLIIWFFGVGQWYSRHYFEKLECTLTDKNLKFKKGIIVQIEKTIPLENIQDISFIEGPLLRSFNLCILKIETAGGSSDYANTMRLVGIVDAPAFRLKVLEQRTRLKQIQLVNNDQSLLIDIKSSLLRIEDLLREKNNK